MGDTRPTYDAFLEQVTGLTSAQGRDLAELARVPDWRLDRGIGGIRNFLVVSGAYGAEMGYKKVAAQDAARSEAATDEARLIAGRDAVDAAERRALDALADRRLSWPRMGLHRPVRIVMWASLAAAAVLFILGPSTVEQPRFALFITTMTVAALAWLAGFLLPPSEHDLRYIVRLAAVAHAAGPSLAQEDFEQLAGGWYAVLEGRWSRGHRPYRAWGCLIIGIVAVIVLAVLLEVSGAGR